jgi:hypothetical protein|tara:strand:- start:215 stop:400 length:186 start_codon:yes stop_codon:yes gene_type:complete
VILGSTSTLRPLKTQLAIGGRLRQKTSIKLKGKELQISQLNSELAQQKLTLQALTRFLVSK